jgi:hypothetical protein
MPYTPTHTSADDLPEVTLPRSTQHRLSFDLTVHVENVHPDAAEVVMRKLYRAMLDGLLDDDYDVGGLVKVAVHNAELTPTS